MAGNPIRQTLADLPPGASAEIIGLDPAAPPEVLQRLRHLGFRVGTRIRKMRIAPLGDPAEYRLLGYDMCLRRREASYVSVSPAQ
ncbi:FeoA family protein [Mycobacterium sp. ITM-2016-00317]|uniref:FeoA family protein n=1 Tax=Mycobacterium sp. ITM-2016-00317 TaxID=2099694 RepID=UPI000D4EBCFD|nr:FeoA family protein [Mycobacterium sp. ITM-2016-00317]WNG86389.1 FeoA family protein [Mycobacterium sp. ITM-2016-00317]